MSFLGRIFGGGRDKENQDQVTPAQAIQKLRETEEMLNKKADFLDKQHQEQMKIVKLNGTRNKKVAIMALKKAKRLEKQRDQVEGTLTTLEAQREALENASTNTEVMKIMGVSARALKQAHGNMDLNKVEDLMDDVREQHEIAEEIATVIRESQGFGTQFDEEELLKELEDIEQEELDQALISTSPTQLPDVPQTGLPSTSEQQPATSTKTSKKDEDEQLEQLKAWALS